MSALLISLAVALVEPAAAQRDRINQEILEGEVGPYPIAAHFVVRNERDIESATYFYRQGIEIPLKISIVGDRVTLTEPDGATFNLRFIDDGSKDTPPSYYNSFGFEGTWTGNGKTYRARLQKSYITTWPSDHRWYAYVTEASDAEFEALARRFVTGVTTGNKNMAALAVSYPLRVNSSHGTMFIKNSKQLKQRWTQIFTPAYVAMIRRGIPHKMFYRHEMAMLTGGDVWFDAKGAAALNTP
jgi:hypothetical protein